MTIRFSVLVAGWFLIGTCTAFSVPLTRGHINRSGEAASQSDAGSLPLHLAQRRGWGAGGGFRAPMRAPAPAPRLYQNYNVTPRMVPPRMAPPPVRIAPSRPLTQPTPMGRAGAGRFGAGTAPWRSSAPLRGMQGRPQAAAAMVSGPRFGIYHALGRPGQGGLYQRLYGSSTTQGAWFYRAERLSNPVTRSERAVARASAAATRPAVGAARVSSAVVDSTASTRRVAPASAGGAERGDGPLNRGWRGAAFTTNNGGTMFVGRVGRPANDVAPSAAATARTHSQLAANQRARNATMAATIALNEKNLKFDKTLPVRDWQVNASVKAARLRADQMLKDNIGYNIRAAKYDDSPTLGGTKTYLTDKKFVDRVLALPRDKNGKLYPQDTANLERELGLNPQTLRDGFTIMKVENVSSRNPSMAEAGNFFYRGRNMQLPGGHPELTIDNVRVSEPGVSEVARLSVAGGLPVP